VQHVCTVHLTMCFIIITNSTVTDAATFNWSHVSRKLNVSGYRLYDFFLFIFQPQIAEWKASVQIEFACLVSFQNRRKCNVIQTTHTFKNLLQYIIHVCRLFCAGIFMQVTNQLFLFNLHYVIFIFLWLLLYFTLTLTLLLILDIILHICNSHVSINETDAEYVYLWTT